MAKKELTCRQALAWQKYAELNRQANLRADRLYNNLQPLVRNFGNEVSRQRLQELDTQTGNLYMTYPDTLEGHRWLHRRYRRLFRQYKIALVIELVHRKLDPVKRTLALFR